MPKNRRTMTRAAALRLAAEAKRERDARLARREAQLAEALADYYTAHTTADDIRRDRQRRIEAVHAEAARRVEAIVAETTAAEEAAEAQARAAVASMRALGEKLAAIAELCRLPLPEVRRLLTVHHAGRSTPNVGLPANEAGATASGGRTEVNQRSGKHTLHVGDETPSSSWPVGGAPGDEDRTSGVPRGA